MTTMSADNQRMRLRLGAVIAAVGALLISWTPAVAAPRVDRAPAVGSRIVPVAGSSSLLVYVTSRSARPLYPPLLDATSVVHLLTASGRDHRLGVLGRNGRVSVSGSTVVIIADQDRTTLVRWWDLAAHTSGSFTTDEEVIGARPHGWLYLVDEGGEHVISQLFTGARRDLGDPIKSGVSYGVVAGEKGFVAYASYDEDAYGAISYETWSGQRRQLLPPGRTTDDACGGMSTGYVACTLDRPSSEPIALMPLGGGKPIVRANRCLGAGPAPVVYRRSAVTLTRDYNGCPDGQLVSLSSSGRFLRSTGRFSPTAIVAALGRIVVANSDQTALLSLASAQARPRRLVAVP